jgi:hypothetical protein
VATIFNGPGLRGGVQGNMYKQWLT